MDNVESTVNTAYELRKLKDIDLWPVLDILAKVIPDDLAPLFSQIARGEKSIEEVGTVVMLRLVSAVGKNLKLVQDEVYDFLSELSGIPANEIPEMEFGTTPKMILEIAKDVKNASFFKELSKLF